MISSSKQSFEEEMSFSIINDENLEMITYWTSLWPVGFIEHFENNNLQTLDLMTKFTLCLSSDKNKTVNDFKTDLMNRVELAGQGIRVKMRKPSPSVNKWHTPNRMQRSESSETPKNEMQIEKWSLAEGGKDRL